MESNFDKQIKAKLDHAQVRTPDEFWLKLEGKLDAFEKPIEEKKSLTKPFLKYSAAAAVVALFAAFSFTFLNNSNNGKSVAVQVKLPIEKTEIKLGKEIKPVENVITVAAVKPAVKLKTKVVKKELETIELTTKPEILIAEKNDLKADLETAQIPVYALKLSTKKYSPSLNDKITIISGVPKNVEVNEALNKKQINIYERLQLLQSYKHHKINSFTE